MEQLYSEYRHFQNNKKKAQKEAHPCPHYLLLYQALYSNKHSEKNGKYF